MPEHSHFQKFCEYHRFALFTRILDTSKSCNCTWRRPLGCT